MTKSNDLQALLRNIRNTVEELRFGYEDAQWAYETISNEKHGYWLYAGSDDEVLEEFDRNINLMAGATDNYYAAAAKLKALVAQLDA